MSWVKEFALQGTEFDTQVMGVGCCGLAWTGFGLVARNWLGGGSERSRTPERVTKNQ